MKRVITGAVITALLGMVLVASADKDDVSVIDGVVDTMTAEELTAPPKPPSTLGPPKLTDSVTLDIIEDLKEGKSHMDIAHENGASLAQVKLVWRKMQDRLRELAPDPVVIESG